MLPWFEQRFSQLMGRLCSGRLHHALLLAGPSGIGKYQLAQLSAKALLCARPSSIGPCNACQSCHLFNAGNHPDFHQLTSEKQLGVDKIREGIIKLSGTAQLGANKVMVIPAADTMTDSAANALLKTLEEPTNNTFILLITDKVQRLLPTILSRCEKHTLPLPEPEQSLDWLKDQGIEGATLGLLKAYGFAPLHLKDALQDPDAFSFRNFCEGMDALLAGQTDAMALASKWQDHAVQVANWCQYRAHERYFKRMDQPAWYLYNVCIEAQRKLQHPGINRSLVLCKILRAFMRPTARDAV